VVVSGKGGTGKTSITAAFAFLGRKDVIVADCDVDAADMHLLLQPDFEKSEDFYSGELAYINQNDCIQCGECAGVCRFNAIPVIEGKYTVDPVNCEGCGYCARVCPANAITNHSLLAGKWYISNIKADSIMVHARLGIGSDNSGKLVAKVKNEAIRIARKNKKKFVIVDGPPGIGCPVISSLSGANFVVFVTEPSVSGLHDLKRIHKLSEKFNLKAGCIINKADLNPRISTEIEEFLKKENIIHISNLPYDESFTKAMTDGQTIVEYDNDGLSKTIFKSWNMIKKMIN
jgi:MinD superfamily P-loop ATPase